MNRPEILTPTPRRLCWRSCARSAVKWAKRSLWSRTILEPPAKERVRFISRKDAFWRREQSKEPFDVARWIYHQERPAEQTPLVSYCRQRRDQPFSFCDTAGGDQGDDHTSRGCQRLIAYRRAQ